MSPEYYCPRCKRTVAYYIRPDGTHICGAILVEKQWRHECRDPECRWKGFEPEYEIRGNRLLVKCPRCGEILENEGNEEHGRHL